MPQMIIANRLIDGRVVFLAPGGQWDTAIAAGTVIDEDAEAERLLEVAKQDQARCLVIDPILQRILANVLATALAVDVVGAGPIG